MKRIIFWVFILLVVGLVLRGGPKYMAAGNAFTAWFKKAWAALTTGKAPES